MELERWRLLRSTLFALLVTGAAVFGVAHGAAPTTTVQAAILAVALLGGVDAADVGLFGGVDTRSNRETTNRQDEDVRRD